jgi:hypothetical protein
MHKPPTNRIRMIGCCAALALALAGASEAALARSSGGGQSGNFQGGGQSGANQGGGPSGGVQGGGQNGANQRGGPSGGVQGGGQNGNFQGGGQGGGRNGFAHSGGRWRDGYGGRRRAGDGGYGEGGDGADESGWGESVFVDPHFEDFADHRFEGLFGWVTGWPVNSPSGPHFYRPGPPCIRRDVYNDVYRC